MWAASPPGAEMRLPSPPLAISGENQKRRGRGEKAPEGAAEETGRGSPGWAGGRTVLRPLEVIGLGIIL